MMHGTCGQQHTVQDISGKKSAQMQQRQQQQAQNVQSTQNCAAYASA